MADENCFYHLPITLFFTATAVLLYDFAVTFADNGMLELQEAKWLIIPSVDWLPRTSWLGLHPTATTVLAQLLLLLPLPFAVLWWMKQRHSNNSAT